MGTWLVVMSGVCGCTMLYAICIQTRGYHMRLKRQQPWASCEHNCVSLYPGVFGYLVGSYERRVWLHHAICYMHPDQGVPYVIKEIATLGKLLAQSCFSLPRSINGYLVGSYERRVWPHHAISYKHPDQVVSVQSIDQLLTRNKTINCTFIINIIYRITHWQL